MVRYPVDTGLRLRCEHHPGRVQGLLGGGVPDAGAVDHFGGRHSNPQTSGLSSDVVDGRNAVPPIDVQLP